MWCRRARLGAELAAPGHRLEPLPLAVFPAHTAAASRGPPPAPPQLPAPAPAQRPRPRAAPPGGSSPSKPRESRLLPGRAGGGGGRP